MRNPTFDREIEKSISRQRLSKYLGATGGDAGLAISLYERNSRLAEAFYTPLQALEICFRNTIAGQLGTRFGTDWFQNGRPSFRNDAVRSIADAANNLRLSRKPVAVDPLIAELSFGFWVSLLGPRYDATLWRQTLYAGFSRSSKPISRSLFTDASMR